ncbi:DUF1566 domain-containing protein [Pseudoalteromonas tunicata]|uniref:Lcl C-terminal domain-containing protein n=1 Tax=Pseudoalteromonas tunicata TaxID=314281 RepID=UPI00273FC2EC|nr:DUF1566 domain-containing protein [Pseudoalteromonas tunicata]MDP4984549.1 DUF1566 domain-containing protein [Pseudoalteromonas tunicata]MDP5214316.1 DUF1566 domain-containing protein [Pseudoalteromonas tunicata]
MKYYVFALAVVSQTAMAQTCYDKDLIATTSTESFSTSVDGTAHDLRTGLMWMRCSLGQTWQSDTSTCSGNALQMTWQQALLNAKQTTFANYSDWHLPSTKELATLVERSCVNPAINSELFPATVAENYWSNTSSIDMADHAWSYAFYSGKNNLKRKQADVFVRLVRYAK